MRFLAACGLAACATAYAQLAVDESATHARLINGKTSVSLALESGFSQSVAARIRLEWLLPTEIVGDQRRLGTVRLVPPGKTSVDLPLPLRPKEDAMLYRLHYAVIPDGSSLEGFQPLNGMLGFPSIAEHAFVLTAFGIGAQPRAGAPYEYRVFAAHPVTNRPVAGVTVTIEQASATTDAGGAAVLRVKSDGNDWESPGTVTIEGRIGDLVSRSEVWRPAAARGAIHIYTDKPLYQPGQTVHVRILAIGDGGRAQADAAFGLRVLDEKSTAVYSADLTTSRFGIAHSDWEVPPNATAGQYRIQVEGQDEGGAPETVRTIEIRRYELPSFRVTAQADRPFYLPGQDAAITVGAEYLFGKPVPGGQVKIAEGDGEKPLREGVLDGEGRLRATLSLKEAAEQLDEDLFLDLHFTAYVTDPTTGRTEQRPFDVRLSRQPVHLYVVRGEESAEGARLYVAAYLPDGTPAVCEVAALDSGRSIGRARTNRFGLARLDLPGRHGALQLSAQVAGGTATQDVAPVADASAWLRLSTDRSLYRPGQAIRWSAAAKQAGVRGTLMAWRDEGQVLFSQALELRDGKAQGEIPWRTGFAGKVNVAFLSGLGPASVAARAVLYPGAAELRLSAQPSRGTYRPGDSATLTFQASDAKGSSVEAALGVALIDRSVLERASTDQATGRGRWFTADDAPMNRIGGVSLDDLLDLPPEKIDDDLQLVAEALLEPGVFPFAGGNFVEDQASAYSAVMKKSLEPVRKSLDEQYRATLAYPRDEAGLARIGGGLYAGALDPWLEPYRARFTIDGPQAVLEFVSAGPDKQFGTADDLVADTVTREWFFPMEAAIREALDSVPDYPATAAEFAGVLSQAGIRFEGLRDPWGTPLRAAIAHRESRRIVEIRSAGPDCVFGTGDDFPVASFEGTYFGAMTAKIEKAFNAAARFPEDGAQFRAVMAAAGIDIDGQRDPWGHPYRVTVGEESAIGERFRIYTYEEYGGLPEERRDAVPSHARLRMIEIRSDGADGVPGTYDDFPVAIFNRLIDDGAERPAASGQPRAVGISGRGTITGVVTDPTGAVVPKAEVTLAGEYRTSAGQDGRYYFRGVPPGVYRLRFQSAGFQATVIDAVPVAADRITRADAVLRVGAMTETVTVEAAPAVVQTSTASMAAAQTANGTSYTPRVRDYFPETLLWNPELVTDAQGRARLEFRLADSITTWRVAVVGSTVDGRIAETSAEVRAFQPFFVDLDPPQTLTVGDEVTLPVPVRNYLEASQAVSLEATAPAALEIVEPPKTAGLIAAGSSANVALALRARSAADAAALRVTARGPNFGDAVERPVAIHPDGRPVARSVSDLVDDGRLLRIEVPADAVLGSLEAQVSLYPSLLSQVIGSMGGLLERPYGCGEQTVSSTYPNLFFLQALKKAGMRGGKLEERARRNLVSGYRRLLGYQTSDGGFAYWVHEDANAALTAYAIGFLEEARDLIDVDEDVIGDARSWLTQQKPADEATRSVVARALASEHDADMLTRLSELARTAAASDDPYAIATFALAALDARKPELARGAIDRLRGLVRDEQGMAWWEPRGSTPYYGWERAGVIETSALAISALARWRGATGAKGLDESIDHGALFLLRNQDEYGTWLTTQATIRVLHALLDALSPARDGPASVEVLVNGVSAGTVRLTGGDSVQPPVSLDVARLMRPGMDNQVAVRSPAGRIAVQARFTARWYEPWKGATTSGRLRMEVSYSTLQAAPHEAVRCEVTVAPAPGRSYGMAIAEIGLPPGAEVDRGVLSGLLGDRKSGVGSFEVTPDHVTFYLWLGVADSRFSFTLRPRYAMRAQTAPSVLYDYYNPDARVVLPPVRFVVEQR